MPAFYEATTPLIPARHQPQLALAYARGLDADTPALLQGTRLGEADFDTHAALLSPAQYLRLLGNAAQALDSTETALALGARLLPGDFGAASDALLRAGSLREALAVLLQHPARLSPLLAPHFVEQGGLAALYWTDACGLSWQRPFVVEMQMAAVASMCHWLSGEPLPWTFCFNRTAPRRTEQHAAYLGPRLRFGCHLDAMLIAPDWLDRPWPRRQTAPAGPHEADALPTHSLLGAVYTHLREHVRQAPGLESTAQHFGMSPATFKRRLAAHGTHFQAELDRARSHVALYLFRCHGLDNDAVAQHLGFHDATNFRRSFKRWTGLTPRLLRDGLLPT